MFFYKINNIIGKLKIGGYIKHHNLQDWWLNELSKEDRELIKSQYKCPKMNCLAIDKGQILDDNYRPLEFFKDLINCLDLTKDLDLCIKIIKKAEKCIDINSKPLDIYFIYLKAISIYDKNKDSNQLYFNKMIYYCEKQIHISQKVKDDFQKTYKNSRLPVYKGYKVLVDIYEKQGDYDKAIKLCEKAQKEGWDGNWNYNLKRFKQYIVMLNAYDYN